MLPDVVKFSPIKADLAIDKPPSTETEEFDVGLVESLVARKVTGRMKILDKLIILVQWRNLVLLHTVLENLQLLACQILQLCQFIPYRLFSNKTLTADSI